MGKDAITMKNEIRAIAKFRSLIISRYFITLLLLIVSLYLGFIRYALSPFYILLALNVLPAILNNVFKEYACKSKLLSDITKDQPFKLNYLKGKYKYSRLNYVSNSISYLITLLLIGLWQYNYSNSGNIKELIIYIPAIILVIGVLLRFLGNVFYQLKIHYDLSHNRV